MTGNGSGRIRLRRDGQQWEYDRAIRDTGRVFHFQPPGQGPLPSGVRMHAMISKMLGKAARRLERLAAAEADLGHSLTALEFYYEAARTYAQAQHAIFTNNTEKRHLHGASIRCYDEVRRLSPTVIEHVDIPWCGSTVSGNLHLAPVDGPAPLVFFVPGCDMTKEMLPHPLYNWAAQRGMHLFMFDGPGQGESNLRDIPLTITNYEDAASAALTWLLDRPEVDGNRIGLYAMSFGSYWGARFAAADHRITAAVLPWASICDKYYLFEEEAPRYKQLFSYLTRATSEAELDEFIEQMNLNGIIDKIACPTLLTVGEFDPRSPLDEVYALFDTMTCAAELWVFADQHHMAGLREGARPPWQTDTLSMGMDWLLDRMNGTRSTDPGQVRYVEPAGASPNDPASRTIRHWFEA